MKNRMIPAWEHLLTLRDPLPNGILTLARFLDDHLPEEYEIYVRPHFNGDSPDVAIFSEAYGATFIHVCQLPRGTYTKERTTVNRNGQSYTVYHLYEVNGSERAPVYDPIPFARSFVTKLRDVYVPVIGEAINNNKKHFTIVKSAVFFPNFNQIEEITPFLDRSKATLCFSSGEVLPGLIEQLLPKGSDEKHRLEGDWVAQIRWWINPPYHPIEAGTIIRLNDEQENSAQPERRKHTRVKGAAGSGKSMMLSQRAARLASMHKRVLIITFNITLVHYLRFHLLRSMIGFDPSMVEIKHFHGFCKDWLSRNGIAWPTGSDQEFMDHGVAEFVQSVNVTKKDRSYDAVLIDEGQDIEGEWYNCLCSFLSENDELLLVKDERQNLYERNESWIDSPKGTRFNKRWRVLKNSYRLPMTVVKHLNEFASRYLPSIGENLEASNQLELPYPDAEFIWDNVVSFQEALNKTVNHIGRLVRKKGIKQQDIAVLVYTHREGLALAKYFEGNKVSLHHIFGSQSLKKGFNIDDSRVKGCTIHSFKGWEIPNVILITPNNDQRIAGNLAMMIYVAMSRTRGNLIVLNQRDAYSDFSLDIS